MSKNKKPVHRQKPPAPTPEVEAPLPVWLRLAPLSIIIAAIAVYGQVLSFGYIGLDDSALLRTRYFIIGNIRNLPLAFSTDAFLGTSGSFYRPLQTVSFMIDALVGGPSPFIYHLTNFLLFIVGCLCLFWLLRTLGYSQILSTTLALLYTVHPLFVSTVAWIPSRGDVFLTIFAIASIVFFIHAMRKKGSRRLVYHGLAFFLALLSKETAVVIPFLCLLVYALEMRKKYPVTSLVPFLYTWIPAVAGWYALRSLLHPQTPASLLGAKPFIKNLPMIPETVGKFFLPFNLKLIPLFNRPDTLLGALSIILLAVLIFRMKGGINRKVLFGIGWFLAFMLPVLAFRNGDAEYLFDYLYHRSFITSIGFAIILAEWITVSGKRIPQRFLLMGAGAIFLFFGASSFLEAGYYDEGIHFFTEAIARTPKSAMCYNNRAAAYDADKKNYPAALKDFSSAIEIYPRYVLAISNRGVTYQRLGRNKEALADFETAFQYNSADPDVVYRRGNHRYIMSDYAGALDDYNRVLGMNRLYPRIYSAKAGCEAILGLVPEALKDSREALQLDPKDEEAYNNRGLAMRASGRFDEAIADFNTAIDIFKKYSRPYNNRGTIYFAQGNLQRAEADFSKAISLDSLYADAWSNRGTIHHRLNQLDSALSDLNTALRINPDFGDAYQNRGVVKNVMGRYREAIEDFDQAIRIRPDNGNAFIGRGISRYNIQDHTGACEDWNRSLTFGVDGAKPFLAQYCKGIQTGPQGGAPARPSPSGVK